MSLAAKRRPANNKGKHWRLSEKSKRSIAIGATGRPKSLEHRQKMSEVRRGSNSPFWRGGITEKNYSERVSIMNSLKYKLWRKSVFERDNYLCVIGGKEHGSKLQADHIKRFSDYPQLRFELSNGRTLCINCHKRTDTYGNTQKVSEV